MIYFPEMTMRNFHNTCVAQALFATLSTAIACVALTATAAVADTPVKPSETVLKAQQDRIAAINKAKKAAISVFVTGGKGGGSGVVVSPDGYAITNFHVAKPCGKFMKCSMPDGRLYDAVLVSIDPVGDVAMLKLFGRDDFPVAELADSDEVQVGDWCFAIGNPFLLATDFQPTVTWGLVSGVHRYQYPSGTLLEYADCIQTDAAINPGNSGGPLFNAKGQLIGINGRGSFEKRGRVNVGVGYAISINQIKKFMGYLHSGRILDHATLGAVVTTDLEGRVIVGNILQSSDAFRRGLDYGDEIIKFGGYPIRTTNEFKNVLGTYPRGWRVPLTYMNKDGRHEILVRLAGVHSPEELQEKLRPQGQQPRPMPMPEPKDDDPKKDGDKKDGDTDKPGEEKKPKIKKIIPDVIKKLIPVKKKKHPLDAYYKSRDGYANYYFNELNQKRVWKSFTDKSDFQSSDGTWTITGKAEDDASITIILDEDSASCDLAGKKSSLDADMDYIDQLVPEKSGGMLPALYLWRRLLTVGPSKFGDLHYLGKAPILRHKELADVFVGVYGTAECHFMFDPATGHLVGLEMFNDKESDPCEIFFGDYRKTDGREIPHQMTVVHGDDIFAVIKLDKLTLTEKPASEKANTQETDKEKETAAADSTTTEKDKTEK